MDGAERDADPQLIYIGGYGRSGSTLLEQVLGGLPDAVAVGELVHLLERGLVNDESCGCGSSFGECPFWSAVGDAAFGGWDRVDVAALRRLKSRVDRNRYIPLMLLGWPRRFSEGMEEYAGWLGQLYRAIATVAGADTVVDSSKHPSTAFLLRRHHPRLHVVHLVRDSRGVAYSWTRKVVRPEVRDAPALMPQLSPGQAALRWVLYNYLFDRYRKVETGATFLRYEDFLAGPRQQTRNIAAAAGRPVSDPDLSFLTQTTVEVDVHHTVAGNPMRFLSGTIVLSHNDAWRRQLTSTNRRLVTVVTAPLLVAYGYVPARRHRLQGSEPAEAAAARGVLRTDQGALQQLLRVLSPLHGTVGPDAQHYAVLPSGTKPRYLLPADAPELAAPAIRAGGSERRADRFLRRAIGPALRCKVPKLLGREVVVPGGSAEDPSLLRWLEERLSIDGLRMAIAIGPPRPNRKPVMQLFDGGGRTIGFAKVAVDTLTERLVRTEATFLAGNRLRRIVVPTPILQDDWRGHALVVYEPLPLDPSGFEARLRLTVPELVEISEVIPTEVQKVTGSAWWQRVNRDLREVDDALAPPLTRFARHLEERLGGVRWTFGAWHGDLTPWNAQWRHGQLYVWDWERVSGPVPVGFDPVHAGYQVAHLREGAGSSQAAAQACSDYGEVLTGLGVPAKEHRLLADCYRLELALRIIDGRAPPRSASSPATSPA